MNEANDVMRRYGGLFGGLIVAGLVGGFLSRWMIGDRGIPGPLLLLGDGGMRSAGLAIVALLILTVVAIVVARMINSAVGMFVLGCGLGVLAMRCGTVRDVIFGGVSPTTMAIETLLWSVAIAIAGLALFKAGGWLADVQPRPVDRASLGRDEPAGRGMSSAPPMVVACAAAALTIPVVWLLLRNDLKGQAIAASVAGGMIAGLLARLWAPHLQPWFVPAAAIAAMGVAQLVAAALFPRPVLDSFIRSDAPRLLAAMPIDIVAGVLAGTAMGFGWSRSFVREDVSEQPAVAAGN